MLDDSKGITLSSLGGIFLATLVGLFLSMITLAYEVWQQKREEKNQVTAAMDPGQIVKVGNKQIQLSAGFSNDWQYNNKGLTPISEAY